MDHLLPRKPNGDDGAIKKTFLVCLRLFIQTLFTPFYFYRAIFFVPTFSPDGTPGRGQFSLTRFIWFMASMVLIFRLFTGGSSMDAVAIGPSVAQVELHHLSKKGRKKKKDPSLILKPGKTDTIWFKIFNWKTTPLSTPELLAYLILTGAYFFRNPLNKGGSSEQLWSVVKNRLGMKEDSSSAEETPAASEEAKESEVVIEDPVMGGVEVI